MYNKALTAENCQKSCFQVQTPKNDTFIGEKCSTHKRLQKVCIISFSKMYNTYRFVAKLWQPGSGEAGKKLKNRHCQQNQAVRQNQKVPQFFFQSSPYSDSLGPILVVRSYSNNKMIEKNQRQILILCLNIPFFCMISLHVVQISINRTKDSSFYTK